MNSGALGPSDHSEWVVATECRRRRNNLPENAHKGSDKLDAAIKYRGTTGTSPPSLRGTREAIATSAAAGRRQRWLETKTRRRHLAAQKRTRRGAAAAHRRRNSSEATVSLINLPRERSRRIRRSRPGRPSGSQCCQL